MKGPAARTTSWIGRPTPCARPVHRRGAWRGSGWPPCRPRPTRPGARSPRCRPMGGRRCRARTSAGSDDPSATAVVTMRWQIPDPLPKCLSPLTPNSAPGQERLAIQGTGDRLRLRHVAAAAGLGGDGAPLLAGQRAGEDGLPLGDPRLGVTAGSVQPEAEDRRVHDGHEGHRRVRPGQVAVELAQQLAPTAAPPTRHRRDGHGQAQETRIAQGVEVGPVELPGAPVDRPAAPATPADSRTAPSISATSAMSRR